MVATEQKVSASSTTDAPHRGLPAPLRALIVLLVLAVIGTLVWYFVIRKPPLPPGVIAVAGRIEGDVSSVAPKVAGKVQEVLVREGDTVTAGQLIATLDAAQVESRRTAAESAVAQAEARVTRARQQIAVLEAQRKQSWLGIDQARIEAQGRVEQAESNVAAAEASDWASLVDHHIERVAGKLRGVRGKDIGDVILDAVPLPAHRQWPHLGFFGERIAHADIGEAGA